MESITTIEWDWLDNSFIADDGTCYKTIEDIPEDLQHLVQPIPEVKKQKYRVRVRNGLLLVHVHGVLLLLIRQ
jgi:hypothetical protein